MMYHRKKQKGSRRNIPLDLGDKTIKENPYEVLKVVTKKPKELKKFPHFAENRVFIKAAVKKNPKVFKYASDNLREDRDFCHQLMLGVDNYDDIDTIYSYNRETRISKRIDSLLECLSKRPPKSSSM
jgi:hypothetical protein